MKFDKVTSKIESLCENTGLNFVKRAELVAHSLESCSDRELLEHLDNAGIIPECFDHDSTEEKLFAKYCDALLARALNALGMKASTILERSDAADVVADLEGYKLVGDAKAFRLSRTAKNQKDFKVEALDKWRKGADYACLVSPLYQFPNSSSQIYLQASVYNVTLLSYTHLAFLIRSKPNPENLKSLWEVAKSVPATKDARAYWKAVEMTVLDIAGKSAADWNKAVDGVSARLPKQAGEQIAFWETEKTRIGQLSHAAAKAALLKALKIDSKIAVIRKNFKEMEEEVTETFE